MHLPIGISVDCTILGYEDGKMKVLLIKRDKFPEPEKWSLPGAYISEIETIENSAKRVLNELTGIQNIFLTQVGIFDEPNRYPDHRVISVLYCALIKPEQFELIAGSHAKQVSWHNLDEIKTLPFDHNKMIEHSLNWLKEEIWRKPILNSLLPDKFPLNQMKDLYQLILQAEIDNRNFRKKVISQELVERLDEKTKGGQQRPAFLYKFKE
ncbi:NUDIX domain-containing protein [Marinilabiliaceae bacterium D04]|uniref:NUDIX domain-containing protein n=2 Tax=Plebeiibacterium marinum TaxID=2992111 RepID=A0AAE3SKB3_9BACT|nr:NUDIX domain-containing protein [Plebeiobacterium marinum]